VRRATAGEGELSLAGEIRLPVSDARFHRRIVRRGRCERGSGDIEQRAGVDQSGAIIAWECEASRGGRPGYSDPGNVITGVLVGYEPESIEPRPPRNQKRSFTTGATPSLPIWPVALAIAVLAQEAFEVSVSSCVRLRGLF
jgi:hypothetical protein